MDEAAAIDRLNAIRQIHLLKARRDRAADTKDWALYESLHAPDHKSFNGDYPPWTTAAEMIANVSRIMANLTTMHHSHTPEITFRSATQADGIWAMAGLSFWQQDGVEHWFKAYGHYYETYEQRGGAWVFTSRRLTYHYTRSSPGADFPPRISRDTENEDQI